MSRIFMSFLGVGKYDPCKYKWSLSDKEHESSETVYAQCAELELLKRVDVPVDRVIILSTETAEKAHRARAKGWNTRKKCFFSEDAQEGSGLEPQIKALGYEPEFLRVPSELSPESQWEMFQTVLSNVKDGDSLIVDITHGFRAAPVVLSSALHFLRVARNITIESVLYGVHDQNPPEIVDYASFYAIQDWTDAVSRLVEEADARRLAELMRKKEDGSSQFPALKNQALAQTLESLTLVLRTVDANKVASAATDALRLLKETKEKPELMLSGKILLELAESKFGKLGNAPDADRAFNRDYFLTQWEFSRVLLDHQLWMQGYTALRELLGSLVNVGESFAPGSNKGRKSSRKREIFIQMIAREDFTTENYSKDDLKIAQFPLEQYDHLCKTLDEAGEPDFIEKKLRPTFQTAIKYRNGMDHAWTSKKSDLREIRKTGEELLATLKTLIDVWAPAQHNNFSGKKD